MSHEIKLKDKYIDPFTDFGFKRLFGEECNKDLLLDFLNELLHQEEGKILSLSYLKTDKMGVSHSSRRAVFDIYCENEKGEKFIVELQKTKQEYFKDRVLYYSTFAITDQATQGDWNFELKCVYVIAILDFEFGEDKNNLAKYRYNVMLTDLETRKVFYEKLKFVYLEMPKFTKEVDELETHFDKWLYVLRNLKRLDAIPDKLRIKIFERMFDVAEIARLEPDEYRVYVEHLNSHRDLKNSLDYAKIEGKIEGILEGRAEGKAEGKMEEKIEIAKQMKAIGIPTEQIVAATKLKIENIKNL
jgi:predicted transposase/invertase (TIGR01784 family)